MSNVPLSWATCQERLRFCRDKKKLAVSDLTPEGNRKWDYFMLVELETLFETGLGVLIN